MLLHFLNRLTEILENSLEIHAQLLGNFLQCQVFLKAQTEDGAMRFREMAVCIITDSIQRFQPFFDKQQVRIGFNGIEALDLFCHALLLDAIDAAITDSSHQIRSGFVVGWKDIFFHQPHKNILYHILSLLVNIQQRSGQMNHLAVILTEKPVKYRFVNHSYVFYCSPLVGLTIS